MPDWLLGVDVGGTFTDVALVNLKTRQTFAAKVLTSSERPAEAVLEALTHATPNEVPVGAGDIQRFLHGTTLTTNALIEGTGRPFALLITAGLAGIVQVKDQRRRGLIADLVGERPRDLVTEELIFEVPERLDHLGRPVVELDEDAVVEIARRVDRTGVVTVAVSLLFSFANPMHEKRVAQIIAEHCPGVQVLCASDTLARIREWPRTSTVLLSAYLEPLLVDYARALSSSLNELGVGNDQLLTMESNGGLMPFTAVLQGGRSAHTLMSGPAAAVQAARSVAVEYGLTDALSIDMGGTSTDISFIRNGEALEVTESEMCGYQIYLPMLDIETVGAGGGTVASVSAAHRFTVGPQSAGSRPGPACYGQGGTLATVTDADVVSGYLSGDSTLAGGLALNAAAARDAIHSEVAEPLGLSDVEAAQGILRLNAGQTADAIKVFAAKRGLSLAGTTLIASGGAGPLHAAAIADELGITDILVPSVPGAFAAIGLLCSDVGQDFIQTRLTALAPSSADTLADELAGLRSRARDALHSQGFSDDEIEYEFETDVRYQGQGFEVRVPVPKALPAAGLIDQLMADFHEAHRRIFGTAAPDRAAEVVSYRVRGRVTLARAGIADFRADSKGTSSGQPVGERLVYVEGEWRSASIWRRADLPLDQPLSGPLIVEQSDTTVLVPAGWNGTADARTTLRLTKDAS
jgi:N-methylhydantoinase A